MSKMSPTKATKILKDYQANNFNAKKTLLENGYSEQTAKAMAKRTLESADKTVKKALNLDENTDIKETADALSIVGFTKDDVVKELKKVLLQDKDLTNKLKAMKPLLDALNYKLDDDNVQSAPSVSLTIEEATVKVPTENPPHTDSGEVVE